MIVGNMEGLILSGRYEIQSLIGQGGMASVYKSYDPNLRRTVAIKIIHPHLSDNPDFTRRFEDEATAVAHLRHSNIIQVFDFNHEGNLYYMVMEFIAGETLQTRLKRLNTARRSLSPLDAAHFMAEICDAADYAHQRGMIHRDIKPANIMLDVHGKAILMDFGIARMVGGSQHTATGAVVGTALYMAPEQIQGLQADGRADIYSMGVTLFEMLSGRPPFEADSAMTLMMMHLNDPVPNIRDLDPDAPAGLVAIIQKAMAKNREARYQSAGEMAAALRSPDRDAGAPVIPVAAPTKPANDIESTMIETPLAAAAGATFIETGRGMAANVTPTAYSQPMGMANQTLIEQSLKPVQAIPKQTTAFPTTPDQSAFPVQKKGGKAWMFILLAVLLLAGVGGFFAYRQFSGKGAGLPAALPAVAATSTPTATQQPVADLSQTLIPSQPVGAQAAAVEPTSPTAVMPAVQPAATDTATPTLVPTDTATPTPIPLIIGGADKIAYFSGGNIWAANLDGSELTQLTNSESLKSYLRWLPDGQGLSYIAGKCIHTVSLQGEDQVVTCFNNAKLLNSFEVSPDGTQVAIGLENQLYLLPFDLQLLKEATTHGDLTSIASCAELAPYARNFGRSVRWSADSKTWAAMVLGVLKDGRRGDLIQVFPVDRCIPNPLVKAQFPEPHFSYKSYAANPAIENFDWDGNWLFVFNDPKRNDGFGDLHIFNMENFKPVLTINPVKDVCCYRDAQWSPDGTHLVFAFQNYLQGSSSTTQLYMVPYGDIGTGAAFTPLPLPEITDAKEKPQPVLRPATGGG